LRTLAGPERAQPSPGLARASLTVTWHMPLISDNRDSDQKGRARRAGMPTEGLGPSPPLAVTLILRQLGRAQVPRCSESMGPGRPARRGRISGAECWPASVSGPFKLTRSPTESGVGAGSARVPAQADGHRRVLLTWLPQWSMRPGPGRRGH
jgi:hypothetical protein